MECKGNKISKKVCHWLDVNEANILIKGQIKESEHSIKDKNNKSINSEIDENFKNIDYGISKEIIDLNRNNLNKYIFLDGSNLDEKTRISDEEHIIYFSKSRSGAKRLKIIDLSNVLIDIYFKHNTSSAYILEFEKISNLVIRILLEKDAKLDLILIDRDNNKKQKLESISVIAKNNSKTDIVKVDLGSNNKYFNYSSYLIEDNAKANIDLAYILSKQENYDISFYQTHFGENTEGNIFIEGVQKEMSSKVFKGTVDFKKGSKNSIGNEYESVINYSKNSKSVSIPILLANEDNIQGNHSANHGEFDEQQLFYIESRGFNKEQAKSIIAEAKIIPILDKVQNRVLKEELKEELRKKLNK